MLKWSTRRLVVPVILLVLFFDVPPIVVVLLHGQPWTDWPMMYCISSVLIGLILWGPLMLLPLHAEKVGDE